MPRGNALYECGDRIGVVPDGGLIGGASATRASAHLDRHWRNLRTLFSHNPTVYKARVLGDIAVNGAALPDSGFF